MNDEYEEELRWQCRNCRAILTRDQCTTRRGLLECGTCLHRHHIVDQLERYYPKPKARAEASGEAEGT